MVNNSFDYIILAQKEAEYPYLAKQVDQKRIILSPREEKDKTQYIGGYNSQYTHTQQKGAQHPEE